PTRETNTFPSAPGTRAGRDPPAASAIPGDGPPEEPGRHPENVGGWSTLHDSFPDTALRCCPAPHVQPPWPWSLPPWALGRSRPAGGVPLWCSCCSGLYDYI